MRRILFIVSIVFSAICVQGQNVFISDSLAIDDIVITQSKIAQNIKKTAKPVQLISNDVIAQSSGKDITQLLNEQVGIDVVGSLSNGANDKSVFMRGGNGEYTLILIDGQPVHDPSGLGGVADLRMFPIDNLDRIEILKGSQSAMYGSDAIAGVINLITKKSKSNSFITDAKVGYGSYNTLDGSVSFSGNAGILDYALGAGLTDSDGISSALDITENGSFDNDGHHRINFYGRANIELAKGLKFKSFLQHSDFQGYTDGGSFSDDNSQYTNALTTGRLGLAYQKESFGLSIDYTNTSTDRSFKSAFGAFPFFGRFNSIEALSNFQVNKTLQVVAGVNYQNHGMLDESTTIQDPNEDILSPFISFIFSPSDKLDGELGYRYNNHTKFGGNSNYSAALSYWISDDIKGFGSFGTGFKAPNLSQLFGAFGANENLLPQKSTTFEIGLMAPSASNIIQPQITFFKRNVEDVIAFDFAIGYFNRDMQNDQGVEIEVGFELGDNLTLKGAYTYLDGELVTLAANGSELKSNNLIRRPKHNFSLSAYFTSSDRWNLSASIKSVGERGDLFFNPDNFFAAEDVTLDSYIYMSAYAQYKAYDGMTLFLDLKNITNSDFQEVYGFSTPGINYMMGARMSL